MAMSYVQMYFSYLEPLADLTDEQVGRVVRAILRYGIDGTVQDLPPAEKIAFAFIKSNFDRESAAYNIRAEQNQENGKKGGAPIGNQNARKQNNRKQPKTTKTTETSQEEEKEDEEEKEEEESSLYKKGGCFDQTMTTVLETYQEYFQQLTPVIQRRLVQYGSDLGAELVCRVIEQCAECGANGWSYVAASLDNCKAKGMNLADYEAEQARRKNKNNARVDRPEHSGNDVLQRARPRRLKREE